MRRTHPAWLFLTMATAACGSSSPTSPPPAPPPPPPQVAATVEIQAGDNQTAPAGTATSVAPAVRVRSQSGQPVAGSTVAFAVDSGGGTVQAATVATGADGIAQAGTWVLGSGRNRLRATVGSLPPVFLTAMGIGDLQVADQTVAAGGGTVAIVKPGDPLNGFRITVPNGAFASGVRLKVGYGDTTGVPRRAGLTYGSPVISISSSAGAAARGVPIELRIPVQVPAGSVPVAILFDRTRGATEVVPSIPIGSTEVAVFTTHFDGARIQGPATGALRATAVDPVIQLVIGLVSYASLAGDLTTGYDPTRDNWEFPYIASGYDQATQLRAGYAVTAMSYFATQKASRGALKGQYQAAPGVWESNARGVKISAAAISTIDGAALEAYNLAMIRLLPPGVTLDSLHYLAVKAGLFLGQPQVLWGADGIAGHPQFPLIVYSTQGGNLNVTTGTTDPTLVGAKTLSYGAGGLGTTKVFYFNPETGQQQGSSLTFSPPWAFAGGSMAAQPAQVQALWPSFYSKTINPGGNWPVPKFEASGDARLSTDTLFVWSPAHKIWAVCEACPIGFPPANTITPSANVVGWRTWTDEPGWPIVFPNYGAVLGKGVSVSGGGSGPATKYGVEFFGAPSQIGQTPPVYLDWGRLVTKHVELLITPQPLSFGEDEQFTLTATYSEPLPPSPRFEWDLGDGRTLTTATNTLTTTYAAPAAHGSQFTYPIKVSLYKGQTLWVVGKADVKVTIVSTTPAWRLTSFTLTSSTGSTPDPLLDDAGPFRDVIAKIEAVPGRGVIFLLDQSYVGPRVGAFTYHFPMVHLEVSDTTESTLSVDSEGHLGNANFDWAATCQPAFAALPQSGCHITTMTNSGGTQSGTLTGAMVGTYGGFPPFPTVIFRLNATKNGRVMSGTLEMTDNLHTAAGAPTGTRTDTWTFSARLLP